MLFWRPHPPHPPLINPLMFGVCINSLVSVKKTHPEISQYNCDSDLMTSHGVQGMISYFPWQILYSQISHYLLISLPPTHCVSWEITNSLPSAASLQTPSKQLASFIEPHIIFSQWQSNLPGNNPADWRSHLFVTTVVYGLTVTSKILQAFPATAVKLNER